MFAVYSGSTRRPLRSSYVLSRSTHLSLHSQLSTVVHWMRSLSASRNLILGSRKLLPGHLVMLHATMPVKYHTIRLLLQHTVIRCGVQFLDHFHSLNCINS